MNILNTGKDIRRLNEIFSILLKYGFGDMLRRAGLAQTFEQIGKISRSNNTQDLYSLEPPERARRAIEEMGPTFVKLGQILATRVDMFSPDWINEFEKLQDNAPVLPYEKIKPQLRRSLGKDPDMVFQYVKEKPLASASMAQVHEAMTRNGKKVVLKIRKPGAKSTIEADLRLMQYIARLITIQSVEARRYHPEDLIKEFSRSLRRELDFTVEAKSAERIAQNLKKIHFVKIPKIYWEWTCEDLSVQEFVQGISAKDTKAIDAAGLDRKLIATRGARIAWKTMLEDGFFHADPHPGNFYILPKNKIAMLDFGMVGKLSRARREQLIKLMRAVVFQETDSAASVLIEWSQGSNINFENLSNECSDLVEQYYGLALNEIDISALLLDVTALMRNHDLSMPSDIALAAKALITLEGFGRLLQPDFDFMAEAEPLVKELIINRYKPSRLAKSIGSRAIRLIDNFYEPPAEPAATASKTSHSNGVLDSHMMDRLSFRLEDSSYQQIQAIYNVGFLLAFVLMLISQGGPEIQGYNILNIIGGLGTLWVIGNVTRLQIIMWWQRKKRDL